MAGCACSTSCAPTCCADSGKTGTMSEMASTAPSTPPPEGGRSGLWRALLDQAPYIVMLAAAFIGVAYTSFASTPRPLYWQVVTPIFGLLCVAAGWAKAPLQGGRWRLVWTQALHWAGFLIAMLALFSAPVLAAMETTGAEIGLLLLLALGTFLAGVHAGSWRIALVGVVLGIAVPLLVMLQRSALLVAATAVIIGAVGVAFVLAAARRR